MVLPWAVSTVSVVPEAVVDDAVAAADGDAAVVAVPGTVAVDDVAVAAAAAAGAAW